MPNKLPNTLTAEAWVSATQFQTWTSYIGYYQDNGPYEKGWWLGANNSKAIFPVAANSNDLNYSPGYSGMELNTWDHIVGVYDGSKVKINQQVAQMVTKTLDALKPITRKKVVQMLGKDSRTFKQAVQAIQRANK